jgi:outer membrane phospholipase A
MCSAFFMTAGISFIISWVNELIGSWSFVYAVYHVSNVSFENANRQELNVELSFFHFIIFRHEW